MARRGSPTSTINANMTPMIDVTFLLIVFFVVVSQIVDRDAVSMDLPLPENAVSGIPELQEHVVVNIVPSSDGESATIIVEGHEIAFGDMDGVTAIVKTRLQGGATDVHLRADRATKYTCIHQVLEAIRSVGSTPRVHLIIDGEHE